ncbi:MAG: hypothetical protein JEY91_17170 [Spirochaetaceae bacterium]|nr:hypothetical protein [Spirochaetaceae bacterium]
MKTRLTVLILLLSAMTLNSQYFFDSYTDVQKLDTAHAYLMVSEQFAKLGDTQQAARFKEMALIIYPELIVTDREELEEMVSATEKVEEKRISGPDRSKVIKYYFSKLLRSITTEDLETADSLIAERLYLPQYNGGLTKTELRPMVLEINETYDLSLLSPEDLYKLETISVEKIEEGTYLLTVEGADNPALYTAGITFFGKVQTFRFRNFDSGWKIDKISAIF